MSCLAARLHPHRNFSSHKFLTSDLNLAFVARVCATGVNKRMSFRPWSHVYYGGFLLKTPSRVTKTLRFFKTPAKKWRFFNTSKSDFWETMTSSPQFTHGSCCLVSWGCVWKDDSGTQLVRLRLVSTARLWARKVFLTTDNQINCWYCFNF